MATYKPKSQSGVYFMKRKFAEDHYQAQVTQHYKTIVLGYYRTVEQALIARRLALLWKARDFDLTEVY